LKLARAPVAEISRKMQEVPGCVQERIETRDATYEFISQLSRRSVKNQ
jgi:hypothetical protein